MANPISATPQPAPSGEAVTVTDALGGSTTAFSREQLAKLAFVAFYSPVLCAPQNIAATVKEIDCCPGCENATNGGTCRVSERGDYCPNDLAETLRQISVALYGPGEPSHYVPAVFGPDKVTALAHPSPATTAALEFQTGTPDIAKGSMRRFIALIVSKHSGKDYVSPLYYLNGYPLEYEECICGADSDAHDDGCPTTGWFYDESNFDYENCYHPVPGDVVSWAELPSPEAARALTGGQ